MLNLAIIIILLIGLIIGLRRGFILQMIHLTGFIIAFIVAKVYYSELAPKLTLWIPYPSFGNGSNLQLIFPGGNFEEAYYRGIAFVAIFFAVKIILQIIGSMLDFVANLPILKTFNRWAGGALGFVEVYLLLFIVLYIAALLPIEAVQDPFSSSSIAKGMVEHTPYLSKLVKELWT